MMTAFAGSILLLRRQYLLAVMPEGGSLLELDLAVDVLGAIGGYLPDGQRFADMIDLLSQEVSRTADRAPAERCMHMKRVSASLDRDASTGFWLQLLEQACLSQ